MKKPRYDIIGSTRLNDTEGVQLALNDNPHSILDKDWAGMTALHWALANHNLEITEILVDFQTTVTIGGVALEADILAKDKLGRTPMDFALMTGEPIYIEILSKRIMPEYFDPDSDWNAESSEGDINNTDFDPKP